MRYLVPILVVTAGLLALDYYVFRNWHRFVRNKRGPLRSTLPVYRVLMVLMPFALPVYLNLFRWWEVEPRLARALFFGLWAIYYVPKVPIALVLLAKDIVRFTSWAVERFYSSSSEKAISQTPASRGDESRMDRAPHELATAEEGRGQEAGGRDREEGEGMWSGRDISRAEFLRRLGWSAAAVPFVATGYGVFRTLYDFNVRRIDVPITGLPRALEGLTIAQVSDLHAGSLFSERPMWEAVSIVNDLQPDLIAVTGDFVNSSTAETPLILPALGTLSAELGAFGCLGNHDHYAETDRLVPQLNSTGVDLLVNAHRTIQIDGARLHVIGTDNTGFNQNYADLPRALEGIDPNDENGDESVRILLAHDPTFWDSHVRPDHPDIDLMLGGHTHGGQFGFEFGPLRWSLAKLRYDRWAGLYREPRSGNERGAQWLYVNRGVGTVGPPLRLGIPPEITLLTLRRA